MTTDKIEYVKEIQTLDGPVPFLKDIWNFFNTKGMKTVIISVNPHNSFNVDLELTECLGCPLHLLIDNNDCENRWGILQKTLKERSIAPEHKENTWLEGIQKKWVLARNLKTKRVEISWNTIKKYCEENSLTQIDFLKIEGKDDNEKEFLYSVLNSGYRPSLVLVRWSGDPDATVPSMLAAGHLQNVGYRLLEEKNGWFFYLYTDVCMYDTCSWRDTKTQNPMVEYFLKLENKDTKETESVKETEVTKETAEKSE